MKQLFLIVLVCFVVVGVVYAKPFFPIFPIWISSGTTAAPTQNAVLWNNGDTILWNNGDRILWNE